MNNLEDCTVLLVDDNSENIDVLFDTLSNDYHIISASNGMTALKLAKKNNPDLILLDIMMPDITGHEVCKQLKANEQTQNIPIIFLSGKKEVEDKSYGFELGAADYITKPFELLEVKARVKTHLLLKMVQKHLEFQNKFLESEVDIKTRELTITRDYLEESQEKFRHLFERNTNAIAFLRPVLKGNDVIDFIFTDVNPSYELLFNLNKDSVVGSSLDALFPNLSNDWLNAFSYTLNSRDANHFELFHNGIDKFISCSTFKPEYEKNYICAIYNDITEQTLYQKELIKSKEAAEENNRLKDSFLANISHEVRTPLNGIIGFARLMQQEDFNKIDKHKYLNVVETCTNNLVEIIDEIIDFSRIESGEILTISESFTVSEIMNEIKEWVFDEKSRLKKEHLDILFPENDSEFQIISDRTRVVQIMKKLINNALKFTDKGYVKISFDIDYTNDVVTFNIEDTGIGISKESSEIIFERFRQEREGYARGHGGIGLGLAISRRTISKLKGEIWFKSEQDVGSTFSFSIPKLESGSEELINISATNENKINNESTVLLFDPHKFSRDFTIGLLKLRQVNYYSASTVDDVMKFFRRFPEIDLILINSLSNDYSILDVVKDIKDFRKNLPVIYQLPHDSNVELIEDLKSGGVDGFLTRPITPESFYNTIENIVFNRQS